MVRVRTKTFGISDCSPMQGRHLGPTNVSDETTARSRHTRYIKMMKRQSLTDPKPSVGTTKQHSMVLSTTANTTPTVTPPFERLGGTSILVMFPPLLLSFSFAKLIPTGLKTLSFPYPSKKAHSTPLCPVRTQMTPNPC